MHRLEFGIFSNHRETHRKSNARNRARPLLLMVAFSFFLPELFSLRFNPASRMICCPWSYLLRSPTSSARNPAKVTTPIPGMVSISLVPGICSNSGSTCCRISSSCQANMACCPAGIFKSRYRSRSVNLP